MAYLKREYLALKQRESHRIGSGGEGALYKTVYDFYHSYYDEVYWLGRHTGHKSGKK